MKFLISTTEIYRVDSEAEAEQLIQDAKTDDKFDLLKYTTEKKDIKLKGEIVDTDFKVSLNKAFNELKEPLNEVDINYEVK